MNIQGYVKKSSQPHQETTRVSWSLLQPLPCALFFTLSPSWSVPCSPDVSLTHPLSPPVHPALPATCNRRNWRQLRWSAHLIIITSFYKSPAHSSTLCQTVDNHSPAVLLVPVLSLVCCFLVDLYRRRTHWALEFPSLPGPLQVSFFPFVGTLFCKPSLVYFCYSFCKITFWAQLRVVVDLLIFLYWVWFSFSQRLVSCCVSFSFSLVL